MTMGSGNPSIPASLPPALNGIEAICFDAFGTLVEIADKRQAVRPLLKVLSSDKRFELKCRLMREPRLMADWPKALEVEVAPEVLQEVVALTRIEASSITMRPGMARAWKGLRGAGFRLAVCSNLAWDYVACLREALPDPSDAEILSCVSGVLKPEPAIYREVLENLALAPSKVMFVGDTRQADVEGPKKVGMKSMHIYDFEKIFLVCLKNPVHSSDFLED